MGISQDTNKPVAWRFPVKVWIGEDRFEVRWKTTTTPDPDRDGLEPLYTAPQPVEQRKPLSDKEIEAAIRISWSPDISLDDYCRSVARWVERMHGIGVKT